MRRDGLLLVEMIDAAEQAMRLVDGHTAEELLADRVRRDALLWNFTVLGEAAAQVSPALKADHPEVDWGRPAQLRNRIVHGYWSVDMEILVDTAELDLPTYVEQLHVLRAALEAE